MDEPALLVYWETCVGELLDRTSAFPRLARYAIGSRLDAKALDILELLAEARFSDAQRRWECLVAADRNLAVLRVLLRLAYDRKLLSAGQLEHLSRRFDESGRMLGGWRKWCERARA